MRFSIVSRRAGSASIGAREGVSVVPGATALTRMPCGAHSIARMRVMWLIPALATP
jgi:hypothetical protein